MKQNFAAMILSGTGQVGGAVVADLLAIPECREVVMVTRKPIAARSRVPNVVLDTGAADFSERTAAFACEVLSQGPVSAVSCVGVGSGSMSWSEEELKRLELGFVGAFALGCHSVGLGQFYVHQHELVGTVGWLIRGTLPDNRHAESDSNHRQARSQNINSSQRIN
jgi:hypothetical protein